MHWIARTYRGLHATRRPDAEIAPHALVTFRHALEAFGFLVMHGERLTPADWCERIASTYAPSARRDRIMAAILACMVDPGAGGSSSDPPSLADYARAGHAGAANPHAPGSAAWMAHAVGAQLAADGAPAPRDVRTLADPATLQADGARFIAWRDGIAREA